jgi:hypothetical protein
MLIHRSLSRYPRPRFKRSVGELATVGISKMQTQSHGAAPLPTRQYMLLLETPSPQIISIIDVDVIAAIDGF